MPRSTNIAVVKDSKVQEITKFILGVLAVFLTSAVIGLATWTFNINAKVAIVETKLIQVDSNIYKIEESQKQVISALNKNTQALTELKATLEAIKEWRLK